MIEKRTKKSVLFVMCILLMIAINIPEIAAAATKLISRTSNDTSNVTYVFDMNTLTSSQKSKVNSIDIAFNASSDAKAVINYKDYSGTQTTYNVSFDGFLTKKLTKLSGVSYLSVSITKVDPKVDGSVATAEVRSITLYDSNRVVITPTEPPEETITINSHPSNKTVAHGNTTTFSVSASSNITNSLSYTWQISTNSGSTWTTCGSSYSGYNTATLSVNAQLANSGNKFRCIVKGNSKSATSNAATLTVTGNPIVINTQPSNSTVNSGSNASFSVNATSNLNKTLTYKWQISTNNGTSWSNTSLNGNTTNNLSFATSLTQDGYKFRCVISDGTNSLTSNAVTLTVKGDYIKISTQPQNISGMVNNKVSFTVSASSAIGSNLTYQWMISKDGGSKWSSSSLTGNKTSTLSLSATLERNGYMFYCAITDEKGHTLNTKSVKLTVTESTISINSQSDSQSYPVGNKVKFRVDATSKNGSTLTYQWQAMKPGGKWGNSSLAGNKTNTLTLDALSARNGYKFRCIISSSDGNTLTSDPVTLTVTTASAASPISFTYLSGSSIAKVGNNVKFYAPAKSTNGSVTYQWQAKKPGGSWGNSSLTGNKKSVLTVLATTARNGYQFRCVVTDSSGKTKTGPVFTLTVNS